MFMVGFTPQQIPPSQQPHKIGNREPANTKFAELNRKGVEFRQDDGNAGADDGADGEEDDEEESDNERSSSMTIGKGAHKTTQTTQTLIKPNT